LEYILELVTNVELKYILAVFIGIGLSSACGFRIFVPPLILSITYRLELIGLPEGYEWVGSNLAIVVLAIATLAEILAYYFPVVDNFLDWISVPASFVAGTFLMTTFIGLDNDVMKWVLAAITGGGSAAIVNTGISTVRAGTTAVTAGLGNWVVSSFEWVSALVLSILSIFVPFIAVIFLLVTFYLIYKFTKRKQKLGENGNGLS
jgi:hypothetical protein